MSYQQLHVGKVKLNGLAGIRHHLLDRDRVKTNPDIDLARSYLNHAIEELSPENVVSQVRLRIKQLQLKRKPRSDAVGLMDIIVGASNDFMLQLGEEKREQYFKDALHFFQKHYGKANVMYCYCHMDEANSHIHIGVIPVTKDGRLSARDLFNSKHLELLQTLFHREVSQFYGLERGQHHARSYLELNKFKLQRTRVELQKLTEDLDASALSQSELERIKQSVQFVSTGIFIKKKDEERLEVFTKDFLALQNMAQEGIKALASIQLLKQQNSLLRHNEAKALADSHHFFHLFSSLEKETALYAHIPILWKKPIDREIDKLQKKFTAFCHDLHRATVRTFIATKGNFDQTERILHNLIISTGVENTDKYIHDVIHSAILQHKKNIQPSIPSPSWKPPKPAETDYKKPDETGIVPLQLFRVPDINWDLIDWELLSELERDEIREKIALARWL